MLQSNFPEFICIVLAGRRESFVPAISVIQKGEMEWESFFDSLKEELTFNSVELVISSAHNGIKEFLTRFLLCVEWQLSYGQLMRNLMNLIVKESFFIRKIKQL